MGTRVFYGPPAALFEAHIIANCIDRKEAEEVFRQTVRRRALVLWEAAALRCMVIDIWKRSGRYPVNVEQV